MPKKIWIFLFLPLLVALLSGTAAAGEVEAIEEYCGVESVYENLPDGIERSEIESATEDDAASLFSRVFNEIKNALFTGFSGNLAFFSGLCAILLLSAVFRSLKDSFEQSHIGKAYEYVSLICLSIFCFNSLESVFNAATLAIEQMNSFMLATLPVSTAFFALGGNVSKAVVQNANLIFAVDILNTVLTTVLLPLMRVCFAFCLVGAGCEMNFGSVSKFLQKTVKTCCVLLFTVLTAILYFQTLLASASDSMAMRGVRFAAGNFIPVVGGLVGEASKTLASSVNLVRTQCGVTCLVILLYIVLSPLAGILVKKIFISLGRVISEILGDKAAEGFLREIGGIFDLLLALTVSAGCYFILSVTLFIKSAAIY